MSPEDEKTFQQAQELLLQQQRRLKPIEENLRIAISMLEAARRTISGQMAAFSAYSLPIPPEMVVSALFDLQTALGGPDKPADAPPKCPVEGEHERKA